MFSEGQKDREAADSNEQETGNTQLCIYSIVLNFTLLYTLFYYTVCTVLNGASTLYSVLLYFSLLYSRVLPPGTVQQPCEEDKN